MWQAAAAAEGSSGGGRGHRAARAAPRGARGGRRRRRDTAHSSGRGRTAAPLHPGPSRQATSPQPTAPRPARPGPRRRRPWTTPLPPPGEPPRARPPGSRRRQAQPGVRAIVLGAQPLCVGHQLPKERRAKGGGGRHVPAAENATGPVGGAGNTRPEMPEAIAHPTSRPPAQRAVPGGDLHAWPGGRPRTRPLPLYLDPSPALPFVAPHCRPRAGPTRRAGGESAKRPSPTGLSEN